MGDAPENPIKKPEYENLPKTESPKGKNTKKGGNKLSKQKGGWGKEPNNRWI